MIFNIDAYKLEHYKMYPHKTKKIFINLTPRKNKNNDKKYWWFGGEIAFKIIKEDFQKNFFNVKKETILKKFKKIAKTILNHEYNADHIGALWEEKKLPIKILSLKEKKQYNYGVPCLIIYNTKKEFYWVPNFIETAINNTLWPIFNSFNNAKKFIKNYQDVYGEINEKKLETLCHDFSLRGLMGQDAGILSGLGHLEIFKSSDNVLAIKKYLEINTERAKHSPFSITATEHSVMSSWKKANEKKLIKKIIKENDQTIAIVGDTWNLWNIPNYLKSFEDENNLISQRKNVIFIRPDSGDTIKILKKLWKMLYAHFKSENKEKMKTLKNLKIILGDGINAKKHLKVLKTMKKMNIHWNQIVFGVGSLNYQLTTRDEHGIAIKATLLLDQNNNYQFLQKKPITDSGIKKSIKGLPKCIDPLIDEGTLENIASEYKYFIN